MTRRTREGSCHLALCLGAAYNLVSPPGTADKQHCSPRTQGWTPLSCPSKPAGHLQGITPANSLFWSRPTARFSLLVHSSPSADTHAGLSPSFKIETSPWPLVPHPPPRITYSASSPTFPGTYSGYAFFRTTREDALLADDLVRAEALLMSPPIWSELCYWNIPASASSSQRARRETKLTEFGGSPWHGQPDHFFPLSGDLGCHQGTSWFTWKLTRNAGSQAPPVASSARMCTQYDPQGNLTHIKVHDALLPAL